MAALTRADVQLQSDWLDVQEAYVAAKAARVPGEDNPDSETEVAYREAKVAMSAMRTYWRQVREAVTVEIDEGSAVAELTTIDTNADALGATAEES